MPKWRLLLLAALATAAGMAPRAQAQTATLEDYVQQGLARNLALQQQEFAYRQSEQALREARGLYLPSLNDGAR